MHTDPPEPAPGLENNESASTSAVPGATSRPNRATASGPTGAPGPTANTDAPVGFLYQAFDDMIAVLGRDETQLAAARTRYEDRRGRVFEDEDLWESWTQAFLECYALEDGLHPGALPVTQYLAEHLAEQAAGHLAEQAAGHLAGQAAAPERDARARRRLALQAWRTSHRSLFEIRALRAGRVELLDILGHGWFAVAEQRALAGVSVGDIAELRLIGFEGQVRFGRTFVFHPTGTRDAIIKHAQAIREQGGSRQDIMDACASLLIRCVRYRHVSPRRVYESSPLSAPGASTPHLVVPSSAASAPEPSAVVVEDTAQDTTAEATVQEAGDA